MCMCLCVYSVMFGELIYFYFNSYLWREHMLRIFWKFEPHPHKNSLFDNLGTVWSVQYIPMPMHR